VQSNRLLRRGQYFYPKAVGVKTGYHSMAGHTLVAAAENGERSLIAVVLNCPNAANRFKDAISLFETAFAEKKVVRTLFAKQYDTFNLHVSGGKIPLIAALAEDLQISYFPSEEPEFKAFLEWKSLTPPIRQGDFAGEIQLTTTEGKILGKGNLYATSTVEPTTLYRLTQFFHRFTPKKLNATMLLSLLAIGSLTATAYYLKRKFKSEKAVDKAE
jgi:D-alanyl-D-alanine carboxypeptidase (penicillin-binding protein 5/6)